MSKSRLEEFLETTSLRTNPNTVDTFIKSSQSKNISIEEWNTLIMQISNMITKDSDTYTGFTQLITDFLKQHDIVTEHGLYLDVLNNFYDNLFVRQVAPPISLLDTAVVLATPTLDQI